MHSTMDPALDHDFDEPARGGSGLDAEVGLPDGNASFVSSAAVSHHQLNRFTHTVQGQLAGYLPLAVAG